MAIPVFFLEKPESQTFLSQDDSFHANKVLRLKKGDAIFILDGQGKKYKAILSESDSRKSSFSHVILEQEAKTNTNLLNLWIAPTKQMERMEWMVEKCTEMGIRSIGFFIAKNSERKEIKLPRLEKIIISASKQSKQLYIPTLNEIIPFEQLVKKLSTQQELNAFACISSDNISSIQSLTSFKKITNVLIGPEGDFNPLEVELLIKSSFMPISLGKSILRTETAGLLCTAAFNISN